MPVPALAQQRYVFENHRYDRQEETPRTRYLKLQEEARRAQRSNPSASSRAQYQDVENELLDEHAPDEPQSLTKDDIEALVDKRIEEKLKPKKAEKPKETEEDGFGKVGGLGKVGGGIGKIGGIGEIGDLTDLPDASEGEVSQEEGEADIYTETPE